LTPVIDMSPEESTPLNGNNSYGAFDTANDKEKSARRHSVNMHFQGSFWEDLIHFREGSIPHSMVIAIAIGISCGFAAYLYYEGLWGLLEFLWKTIPEKYVVGVWPEWAYPLYIPLMGYAMSLLVGLSVKFLGDPGDLAHVIECVHEKGYISVDHSIPMICASQFSILGGGSLGPEAPLVAIAAAISGFISRSVFHNCNRNIVRKHTLMGMAGALAAFFGCPLGGSLFALEVTSRLGMEYYEHAIEAIFCGEITLAVFRALTGLPISAIWEITPEKLDGAKPYEIVLGILIGLLGGFAAYLFAQFHEKVMSLFRYLNLMDDSRAVPRALLGGTVIIGLGLLVPHSMFWGEYEIDTIATLSPASTLTHVWPTTGATSFEMDSFWTCMVAGFAKLVAISWTVAGGYRGGFIFPLFAAGMAFGRAIVFIIPVIPIQLATLGMAAAINVSITRTALATPVILVYLSGESDCLAGVMASSLTALFVTSYMVRVAPVLSTLLSTLSCFC
jgi:H+/Cl- antiporter ClcA